MREILFRGKGTCGLNAGDWIYGYYVKDFWKPTRCGCGIIPIDKERGGYCEVNPSTIGQYTGLTDKNGNKIFEGDIVKSCEYDDIYTIKYFDDDNYPAFDCVPEVPSCECNGLTFLVNTEGCEIIGNIYDNPKFMFQNCTNLTTIPQIES